jgi:hypothetical protein
VLFRSQIIDSVLRRREDYFTILTTRRAFVNGPLSQLYRLRASPRQWSVTSPTRADLVPEVPLRDTTTWREYVRDEWASGVLTTPAWLYRFPTQRARINRLTNAFLCRSFSAGAEPPPPPEDGCHRDANLATRCGCKGCHAAIEPRGAA